MIPKWLLEAGVSARAVQLYAVLGCYADRNDVAFPSRKRLAKDLGVSDRTVDATIKELVEAGALEVIPNFKGSAQTSNIYRLIRASSSRGGEASFEGGAKPASHELEPLDPDSVSKETAQEILALAIDTARERGITPTPRWKGIVSQQAKQLLQEGIAMETLRAATTRLVDKSIHPSSLFALVAEVEREQAKAAAPPAQRRTGWRFVRGTHGGSYVRDPNGVDPAPRGYA